MAGWIILYTPRRRTPTAYGPVPDRDVADQARRMMQAQLEAAQHAMRDRKPAGELLVVAVADVADWEDEIEQDAT